MFPTGPSLPGRAKRRHRDPIRRVVASLLLLAMAACAGTSQRGLLTVAELRAKQEAEAARKQGRKDSAAKQDAPKRGEEREAPQEPQMARAEPRAAEPRASEPAPAARTPSVPARERAVHVVQRGETSSAIARRYGLALGDLLQLNPGIDLNHVEVGQRLFVPQRSASRVEDESAARAELAVVATPTSVPASVPASDPVGVPVGAPTVLGTPVVAAAEKVEVAQKKETKRERRAREKREKEEARRLARAKQQEERRAAEQRRADAVAARKEEARRAEAAKVAQAEARRAEEARRVEERKAEEVRRVEERKAEEVRRVEERKAEEARQAEAARKAEEARQAEAARKAEEARRAEAEAKLAEVEAQLAEARRLAEAKAAAERRAEEASRRTVQKDSIVQGNWIKVDRAYPPLDFRLFGRPIADVASLIAEKSGQNIVLSDEQEVRDTRITGEIRAKPWHVALEALLEAHGLRAVQDPKTKIITIVTPRRAAVDRRPYPIRLKYLYAKDIVGSVRRILGVLGDSTANAVEVYGEEKTSRTLIAYASPDKLSQVEALIDSLDTRPPKVSVEVRMATVNRTAMEKKGFSFSFVPMAGDGQNAPNTGVMVQQNQAAFRTISSEGGPMIQVLKDLAGVGPIQLNVFLDAVTGAGLGETETTPLITANSGVTSEIMVGDAFILPNNTPVFFGGGLGGNMGGNLGGGVAGGGGQMGQYPGGQPGQGGGVGGQQGGLPGGGMGGGYARFETGTTLKVTPHVMGDSEVLMTIDLVRDGGSLAPDGSGMISGGKHSATTEVVVKNDVPIVIGGLTTTSRSKTHSGVPVLSKLPILGALFRREEMATQYQDLIILVTPHIHEEEATTPAKKKVPDAR